MEKTIFQGKVKFDIYWKEVLFKISYEVLFKGYMLPMQGACPSTFL